MPTSTEGGSEGGTQTTVEILQPAAVESPGGEQSSNVLHSSSKYDRLKERMREFAIALSRTPAIGRGAATADSGDRRLVRSAVVVDEESTRTNRDVENGGVPISAAGAGVALETFSDDSHQDSDKESECRICQMSSTDVVINLGCRCKLDLSRAHKKCAETWFNLKGDRRCEICWKIARNIDIVEIPEIMDSNSPRSVIFIAIDEILPWRSRVVNFLQSNIRKICRIATIVCIIVSIVVGVQAYAYFMFFRGHYSHKK